MSDHDRRLSAALAELPRTPASPGFRDRVMRRIATARAAGSAPRPAVRLDLRAVAAAAALLLVIAAVTLQELHHRRAERRAAAEIAVLQAEYDGLARELAALERQAAAARPVMRLGGDEQVEVLVDVASFANYRPAATAAGAPPPRRIY